MRLRRYVYHGILTSLGRSRLFDDGSGVGSICLLAIGPGGFVNGEGCGIGLMDRRGLAADL